MERTATDRTECKRQRGYAKAIRQDVLEHIATIRVDLRDRVLNT